MMNKSKVIGQSYIVNGLIGLLFKKRLIGTRNLGLSDSDTTEQLG